MNTDVGLMELKKHRAHVDALGIGSRVWVFDINRRVYRGQSFPVYREHFVPQTIVDQTRVSWILSNGMKVNKKYLDTKETAVYPSEEAVNDAVYVHEQSYRISQRVLHCLDATALRAIDVLLGIGT